LVPWRKPFSFHTRTKSRLDISPATLAVFPVQAHMTLMVTDVICTINAAGVIDEHELLRLAEVHVGAKPRA